MPQIMRIEYLIPILSYFLGSIPFGYLLIKYKDGQDIRSVGSGNIGATNVFRKSRAAGILTYLLDAGKGYLAVVLAAWMSDGNLEWKATAAVFAIVGHIFTVWLRFKGGKGVATGCGAFLALSYPALLTTLGCFMLILILTRYVSAASIGATILFPLLAYVFGAPAPLIIGAVLGAVLIIARHYQNIQRLLSGKENRLVLKRRS
jgi:acyl phosphate:glycerol-3-phosphate acyltransferase